MTTRIQVSDAGLEVIPPRDTLTQGSENMLTLEFEFFGAWLLCGEYNAVFTDDINSATVPVTGGACVIPVEVLQNPWRFVSISLTGTSASGVITSPFVRIGQVLPSASGGEGGKFVTMAQLQAILLDYVLRAELGEYVTHEALDDALAAYIKESELAEYWSKSEICLQTDGDGKEFLANDGQYHTVQGDDDKAFIAEYAVTTAQEIIAYLDASKEPFAPILVKRGTDYYTVTTASKQGANKIILLTFASLSGNYYTFTYTITNGTWGNASYGFQKLLESGTNIKTINGESLLGSGDIQIQGGTQVQADWNQTDTTSPAYIKNKPTIPDISGLATQASVDAVSDTVSAIDTRVGTAETNITALQNDKADKTQLADYETSEHAAATFAQKADIADMLTKPEAEGLYADKASMLTLENTVEAQAARIGTAETNITALQTDIAGKASDADLQALASRMDAAETNISTLQTDVAGKADASVLADYETTAHAATTYETKADASKIKSITAAGFAVTPDSAGDVNIGGTDVSRVSDSGSWGSEITYTISQTLPTGASSDTKGSSLTIFKRTENSGATPRITMTIDGVQIATSADIPDVSQFATTDYVQNTFESTAHASATYLKIADAASTYATQSAISDMATQTWVQNYISSLDGTNMRF